MDKMNDTSKPSTQFFKKCPCCGYVWTTREELLSDPSVKMIGYQVNFEHLELGLFLFKHIYSDCGTAMAIEAGDFKDLYNGPIYAKPLRDTDKCPDYCLNKEDLRPCPAECECAYVREVIQIIKHWTKNQKNN